MEFFKDDLILPFYVNKLGVRGRLIKLGKVLDAIINTYNYPEKVAHIIADAVTLTVILGSTIKFSGKFIVTPILDKNISYGVPKSDNF